MESQIVARQEIVKAYASEMAKVLNWLVRMEQIVYPNAKIKQFSSLQEKLSMKQAFEAYVVEITPRQSDVDKVEGVGQRLKDPQKGTVITTKQIEHLRKRYNNLRDEALKVSSQLEKVCESQMELERVLKAVSEWITGEVERVKSLENKFGPIIKNGPRVKIEALLKLVKVTPFKSIG